MPDATSVASSVPGHDLKPRLLYLDGWRGLAIALVLVGHFTPIPGIALGSAGVDLFFVLSGRLIAEILFVDREPIGGFIVRRVARVYPSLLMFVLLVGPLHLLMRQPWPDAVLPLTFTANYAYAVRGEPFFFGHLWSLCVEEHAYLVLAVLASWHRARAIRPATVIAVLAACVIGDLLISEIGFGQSGFEVLWRTDARAGSLLASASLHLALRRHRFDARKHSWLQAVPITGLCGGICLYADGNPQTLQYTLSGLCLAVAVNTLEHGPGWFLRQMQAPTLLLLAQWSYSIYLWQQPFFMTTFFTRSGLRCVFMALAVAVGILAFYAVERPARRTINAWWRTLGGWKARGALQPTPSLHQPLL